MSQQEEASGRVEALVRHGMRHGKAVLALVLALTALLGSQAVKVRPDYSVELLFPIWDPARQVYDRFKAAFPHEDTRAVVVVTAPDVLAPTGLVRLAALERELARVPGVEEAVGPLSARTLVLAGDRVQLEPLLPGPDVPPERLEYARKVLTSDPLYMWNVARPDASSASIVLRLAPALAGTDEGRQQLSASLREVVSRHEAPGQQLVLSGVPIIRATFASMLLRDVNVLVPAALVLVLALLFLAFRHLGAVLASLATILVSLAWMYGVLGLLGFPLSMMVSVLPIIVIIICVSDSVHITNDFLAELRQGLPVHDALHRALVHTALPCLLTEVVLACGFLSLVTINITAVAHFGLAASLSMLGVWVANVTVLPLALSRVRVPASSGTAPGAPAVMGVLDRFSAWIALQVTSHPRRIVATSVLVLGAAAFAGTRVSTTSYVFDDLRPGSPFALDIQRAEQAHGGVLPLALFIEATSAEANAALEPELIRLADRGAAMLRELPEVEQANSLGDSVRHAASALGAAPSEELELPATRAGVVRQLGRVQEPRLFQDVLAADGRSLAVQGRVRDCGSECIEALFGRIETWMAREQAVLDARPGGPIARIHATGQARIFKDVNDGLMKGLGSSFALSLGISFLVMCLVLRSWRLGLIGLIPNVVPAVLVLGFMSLMGIALKPVTVVLFSVTLVIAEDDTLQLLSRLRKHYARARAEAPPGVDPHLPAALSCMREVARPILLTSAAVSGGFLLLLFSSFLGPAHLGLLIGATLFAAVFADLFLTPLLIIHLRPFADRRLERAASVKVST
jgi:hypothetical protein